jgi:glycosyltransferase involved in cell wall biosynthesis
VKGKDSPLRGGRPRLAVIHPDLTVSGGSQAPAVWLAGAAVGGFRITLISSSEINLERLDRFYGTRLAGQDIATVTVPPAGWAKRVDALRGFRLERYCRKKARDFDILVSAYNVMDFAKRGIQFIADFSFDDGLRRAFDAGPLGLQRFLYARSPLRSIFLRLAARLAGRREEGWKRNITIANSSWTRNVLKRELGLESHVIYPPATGLFPDVPWTEKEDGFVVLGRIEPEKRLERILSILGRVRAAGFDVHVHILGTSGNQAYIRSMESLCRDLGPWAVMEGLVEGKDKCAMIARHKYGLSGRAFEPFGIAVAEMAKAGCLVWVPRGGGQAEIVGLPELIFANDDDAVGKIVRMLAEAGLQEDARRRLRAQSARFSESRFVDEVRDLLTAFLKEMTQELGIPVGHLPPQAGVNLDSPGKRK